jgi:putative heme-binding domain-containing protein
MAERSRLDAIEAVSQAKLTNAIPQLVRTARSPSPALGEAAVRAVAGFGSTTALPALTELAREAPITTRREAIIALGNLREASSLAVLLEAKRNPDTRDVALAALTVRPSVEAVDAYLDALAAPDAVLREKARRALREVRDQALPRIESQAARLTPGVIMELRRVYEDRPQALAQPFLAEVAAAALSTTDFAKHALASKGDAWRGQKIFFDEQRVACVRCHAVHGWGGGVGPELTTAGAQFGRAVLIESILEPSKVVREGYQQVELELRSGETLSGIVKAENAESVTLFDADGRSRAVARNNIASRRNSALSLMPEGLQAVLSLDEFADLIAYVESLQTDPRRALPAMTPEGFEPLLNSSDLPGWHSVAGREPNKNITRPPKNWSFHDGVLEHDGHGQHLWTDRQFGDFVLRFDWRWPDPPKWEEFPVINPDGYEARAQAGAIVRERVLDCGDSGVFVRGLFAAQANLFCYPVGSGEFWELRESAVGEARRPFTPRYRADRPLGQWNRMELVVRGDTVTVVLNSEEVISSVRIPGLSARGPIGFQHEHGRLQIANIFVQEFERR